MFLKDSNNFTVEKANTLTTARTINGTSFNGSANITTANWGTARTITIGSTGKSVNGSANISWSLSEIGAAAASHTHSYLPLSGGTMTGKISNSMLTNTYLAGNQGNAIINSTGSAGSYTMLYRYPSTNGYFTTGGYQGKYLLQYTTKSTVDAGTNSVTKSVTLLDESGNSSFPGIVTASNLTASGISIKDGSGKDRAFVFHDSTGWFTPKAGFHIGDDTTGLYLCGTEISFCNFSGDTSISRSANEEGAEEDHHHHHNHQICKIYHEGFKPTAKDVNALSVDGGTVVGETTFESAINAESIYSTNAINIASDRNLKNAIKYIGFETDISAKTGNDEEVTLKDMYDFVKDELGLASYTMMNDKEEKKKINFIAQDLLYSNNNEDSKVGQLIINAEHAVSLDTNLTYDLGNYNSVIAGALQYAIQLFSSKIEELEQEIEKLKG